VFESVELGRKLPRAEYARREPALREALLDAQVRLGESDFAVVIVIAGAEGAGKGETVNALLEWMDARGIQAHALGAPTQEESERPDYFRFWRRLPATGEIAVFFGSWYTRPITERSLGRMDGDRFDFELSRIADFERMLVDEGVLLVKFWLHVTKKQQRKRFARLEADPDTAWRVTPRDWEFHATYDDFVRAAARALRRTDTAHAPWTLVEAHDRRFRHVAVGERLLGALEQRLACGPPPSGPTMAPQPERVGTGVLQALDLDARLERAAYEDQRTAWQGRLGRLARRMNAADCSAVLVFEGPDAAGKGGAIRRVVRAIDSRFYRVIPIGAPTDEELAHPYLWRFWRHLPGRGHFAVFDRSWYGRVLVERVEGLCPPRAWQRAYAEINAFEEQLVEAGTLVIKFWLAISEEEQLRRFREREATGYKRYKLTPEDWRNRAKAPAYAEAACEMIERTSTEIAPWHLVAADDKLHARIEVLRAVCEGLERAVGPDEKPSGRKRKRKRHGGRPPPR
jgi:polyphosphate:AMP phosphotransferase